MLGRSVLNCMPCCWCTAPPEVQSCCLAFKCCSNPPCPASVRLTVVQPTTLHIAVVRCCCRLQSLWTCARSLRKAGNAWQLSKQRGTSGPAKHVRCSPVGSCCEWAGSTGSLYSAEHRPSLAAAHTFVHLLMSVWLGGVHSTVGCTAMLSSGYAELLHRC
jgi:hypothetical protein